MSHNLLTNTVITREAARILHQEGTFFSNINLQHQGEFAVPGKKVGSTIGLRLPAKYTVRTNATYTGQDHIERSTPLAVLSQYGIDVSFTSADRTLSLDDFSKRVLRPAVKQLAAKIEYDCLAAAYKLVNNGINATTNTAMTYRYFQKAGQRLTEELAPITDRTAILCPPSVVEFLDATKGLFAHQSNLNDQFREGMMGRTGGFDVGENTLLPTHTTGTMAGSPLSFGNALGLSTTGNSWASTTAMSVTGATGNGTLKAGDIITFSGVYAVHAESKQNTGRLQQFVVQSDVTMTTATSTYTVTVKPAMIYGAGNAFQNCVLSGVSDSSGLTVTRLGASATAFAQDLFFHKDAFAAAFVGLEDVGGYGGKSTVARSDEISMRFVQGYDITNDRVAGRLDVLFGFGALLPELAARHLTTQSILA